MSHSTAAGCAAPCAANGNSAYARTMRELSTLTCLAIVLYDAPTSTSCRADEHALIVDAVGRQDAKAAEALMLEHLEHIESGMRLDAAAHEPDLAAIFR
jgi:DNA-binding GntR family transcriptional regulator